MNKKNRLELLKRKEERFLSAIGKTKADLNLVKNESNCYRIEAKHKLYRNCRWSPVKTHLTVQLYEGIIILVCPDNWAEYSLEHCHIEDDNTMGVEDYWIQFISE